MENEGAGTPDVWGICGVPGSCSWRLFQSPLRSVSPQSPLLSSLRSVSPQSPLLSLLRSVSPQSPLQNPLLHNLVFQGTIWPSVNARPPSSPKYMTSSRNRDAPPTCLASVLLLQLLSHPLTALKKRDTSTCLLWMSL